MFRFWRYVELKFWCCCFIHDILFFCDFLTDVRDYRYNKNFIFGPHYQDFCRLRKTIVGITSKEVPFVIQRMWYFHHNLIFLDLEILLFWNLLKALKSQWQLETDIYLLNENKDQSLTDLNFASIMHHWHSNFLNYGYSFQDITFLNNYCFQINLV